MPIQVQCPTCNKQAAVPDSAAGKNVKCGCGTVFAVEAPIPIDELSLQQSTPEPQVADDIVTRRQKRATNQAGGQTGEGFWNALTRQRGPFAGVHSQSTQAGKPKPTPAQNVLGCFAIVFVLGVFYMLYHLTFDHSATGGPSGQAAPQAGAPVAEVNAGEIYKQFDSNEIDADNRYKGKIVRVVGIVQNVGRDITGTPYVFLNGNVQALFDKGNEAALSRIASGTVVKITGRCDGKFVFVLLKDCSVEVVTAP